jgi:putative transposase
MPVTKLARQVGISESTLYNWNERYAGLRSDQVGELKQLQNENVRLNRLVAKLRLDKMIQQDINVMTQ